ncbi:MAG: DUF1289 domain-containing protein [Burkholderiales bacterium]
MSVYARIVAATAQRVANTNAAAPSPCVSVCQMDEATGWCEGCLRTIDEIMDWGALDESAKRIIWRRLAQRADVVIKG